MDKKAQTITIVAIVVFLFVSFPFHLVQAMQSPHQPSNEELTVDIPDLDLQLRVIHALHSIAGISNPNRVDRELQHVNNRLNELLAQYRHQMPFKNNRRYIQLPILTTIRLLEEYYALMADWLVEIGYITIHPPFVPPEFTLLGYYRGVPVVNDRNWFGNSQRTISAPVQGPFQATFYHFTSTWDPWQEVTWEMVRIEDTHYYYRLYRNGNYFAGTPFIPEIITLVHRRHGMIIAYDDFMGAARLATTMTRTNINTGATSYHFSYLANNNRQYLHVHMRGELEGPPRILIKPLNIWHHFDLIILMLREIAGDDDYILIYLPENPEYFDNRTIPEIVFRIPEECCCPCPVYPQYPCMCPPDIPGLILDMINKHTLSEYEIKVLIRSLIDEYTLSQDEIETLVITLINEHGMSFDEDDFFNRFWDRFSLNFGGDDDGSGGNWFLNILDRWTWPSLPSWSWPSLPSFSWPSMPSWWGWPSLPSITDIFWQPIRDFFSSIFVPNEGFLQLRFDTLRTDFNERLPFQTFMDVVYQLRTVNETGSAGLPSQGGIDIMSEFNLFPILQPFISIARIMVTGLYLILFVVYNLRQIQYLIRGSYLHSKATS